MEVIPGCYGWPLRVFSCWLQNYKACGYDHYCGGLAPYLLPSLLYLIPTLLMYHFCTHLLPQLLIRLWTLIHEDNQKMLIIVRIVAAGCSKIKKRNDFKKRVQSRIDLYWKLNGCDELLFALWWHKNHKGLQPQSTWHVLWWKKNKITSCTINEDWPKVDSMRMYIFFKPSSDCCFQIIPFEGINTSSISNAIGIECLTKGIAFMNYSPVI